MRLWSSLLLILCAAGSMVGHAAETTPGTTTPTPATPAAVEAPASTTPAATPTPTPAATTAPTTATAAAPAPDYAAFHLANKLVEVDIIERQGAVRSISLRDTHPIRLRTWQAKAMEAKGQQPEDPAKSLAVLSAFNPSGDYHNWISGIGLEGVTRWTRTSGDDHHLVLSYDNSAKGLRYTITYELPEDSLALRTSFTVENTGTADATIRPAIYPLNGVHQDDVKQDATYLALAHHNGGATGKMTSLSLPPLPTAGQAAVPVSIPGEQLDYVALKSRFFVALWHPLTFGVRDANATSTPAAPPAPVAVPPATNGGPGSNPGGPGSSPGGPGTVVPVPTAAGMMTVHGVGFSDYHGGHQAFVEAILHGPGGGDVVLKPTQHFDASWTLTVASMTAGDVKRLGEIAGKTEFTDGYYRFFRILASALTFCLSMLVLVVQNYGVAVVVLTFLIKLALHRTTFKQQESMMKMQKLAPELKLIQEQYKNDKQKLAQKQMELWKKNGVNPLGGCLPIFIQIPIFTALYLAFSHSADMRGHGFLWVNDLTLPDQIIGWVVAGWSLSLNPLPIIYIAVSIWMSLMQKVPPGADPQQEQMMKTMRWMPVIFGVIFYNFPSGLVLYFTINAVLSTIEIKMVRKKLGLH